MAVVRINYEEFSRKKDLNYKGVEISLFFIKGTSERQESKTFYSGNFVRDWFDMTEFWIKELAEFNPFLSCSSSIGHFITDGAPFDGMYLKLVDGKPYLTDEYDEEYTEFFVPKGTKPTWEELKSICKHI